MDQLAQMFLDELHQSSFVMLGLLMLFAVIHSGGAAIRDRAESLIGARAWRLLFATASIPSALLLIIYFILHRYDGVRLWNVQGVFGITPVVWVLSAISFLFLYPATYNLLEIPALRKPEVRIYTQGIMRITRHPQAIGQILWCLAHQLWIGTSFTLVTCCGLIGHHLFAVWHGDRRLKARFGDDFEQFKSQTSIIPFAAVVDGRQELLFQEFFRPSQLGIAIAIGLFWRSHRFISPFAEKFLLTDIGKFFG